MTSPEALPEIGCAAKLDGMVVNYHDRGSGRPVLLVHGSGPGVTAWANWRLAIPELSRMARVIAPDMAGFGYTSMQSPSVVDKALWVRQLVALLDHLELEQVSVVGNSFGGGLALALADAHPTRVNKLVLMGPVGCRFPITAGLERVWGYTPSLEAMRELLGVFVYDKARVNDDLVDMRYRASVREDVQARFASLFPAPRQRWIDMLALDDRRLGAMRKPVLIMQGREDEVIPLAASERLCALLPNARLEVIEQCGHWVQIEHPGRFVQSVAEFLFDVSLQSSKATAQT